MTNSFFAATFSANRADALIGQIQAGLAGAPLRADTALVLADEACGQALIDRVMDWLAQEIGSKAVCALPVMGREGAEDQAQSPGQVQGQIQGQGQAQVQVLLGQTGAAAFGPIDDWSFDGLFSGLRAGHGGANFVAMDPRTPFFAQRLNWMHEAGEALLMGAIGAPSGTYRGPTGLCFGYDRPVIWQTFPGAERLEGDWTITAAQGQVIHEINARPALDVLKEVAGDILARKVDQIPAYLFPAFPVSAADQDDFLIRRINGLGQSSGSFSIEDEVLPGMPLAFARRNGPYAIETLGDGVTALLARAGARPRAAVFLSDQNRAQDFQAIGGEAQLVRHMLGDIPLISGTVQGVINHNRLYSLASQLIFIL